MGCDNPLKAYREIGGAISFNPNRSPTRKVLMLPCGQCTGCRLERSRQWAMRCMHEAKMHAQNTVVTLTYDNEHLPCPASLSVRTLQLFMKKLRKKFGKGIRFYACGEYGEENKRPHYHVILFNMQFPDLRFYKKDKIGGNLYTSEVASEIWGNGFAVVGEVTFETCAYIARYVVDKITGERAKMYYSFTDPETGEVIEYLPEFTNMSRKPGIGRGYFDKYGAEVYAHDSVVINAMEVRPPRYYDVLMDAIDPKRMKVLKRKRMVAAQKNAADNTPARRRVKEAVLVANLSMWKRNVT